MTLLNSLAHQNTKNKTMLLLFLFTISCFIRITESQNALDENSSYCQLQGKVQDALCYHSQVEQLNQEIHPRLQNLLRMEFFRYYKIDLNRGCPFWQDSGLCMNRACAVETLENEEEIRQMWNNQNLGAVEFSSFSQDSPFKKKCDFTEKDFCMLEDDTSELGVYVDLLKNPERFTGYAGESARQVWMSIYNQNCFPFVLGTTVEPTSPWPTNIESKKDICLEKRAFYRVISGLHTSISIHLCDEWLNKTTGEWVPNLECFDSRVGKFPDRLRNLHFIYVLVLQAVHKLKPFMEDYQFCTGNRIENIRTKDFINTILLSVDPHAPFVQGEKMFADEDQSLKEEFKARFRNISRIMDCVGCEKCRLWGKLQISGIGTALKILFSFSDDPETIRRQARELRRTELVSLWNALGRLSESLQAVEGFRKMRSNEINAEPSLLVMFWRYEWFVTTIIPILALFWYIWRNARKRAIVSSDAQRRAKEKKKD